MSKSFRASISQSGNSKNSPQIKHSDVPGFYYSFAVIILGILNFLYMFIVNLILKHQGFSINPTTEALFATLVFYLAAPVFVLIAIRSNIILNTGKMIMFIFMIFLPMVFVSTVVIALIRGVNTSYFGTSGETIAWAETFALKVLKAFPIVVGAPFLFVQIVRYLVRRRVRRTSQVD